VSAAVGQTSQFLRPDCCDRVPQMARGDACCATLALSSSKPETLGGRVRQGNAQRAARRRGGTGMAEAQEQQPAAL
jgi:hypothetical protein